MRFVWVMQYLHKAAPGLKSAERLVDIPSSTLPNLPNPLPTPLLASVSRALAAFALARALAASTARLLPSWLSLKLSNDRNPHPRRARKSTKNSSKRSSNPTKTWARQVHMNSRLEHFCIERRCYSVLYSAVYVKHCKIEFPSQSICMLLHIYF